MTENTQPVFTIEKLYVKDLSLEVPNAPQIYLERETPQINVQLNTTGNQIDEGIYEVVLTVTVAAKLPEDRTVFLVEVAQGGIFQIRNVPADDIEPIMMIGCANILFPYAREVVSDAVTRSGFQPVLLAPVNFEALFQAQKQQAGAKRPNNGHQTLQPCREGSAAVARAGACCACREGSGLSLGRRAGDPFSIALGPGKAAVHHCQRHAGRTDRVARQMVQGARFGRYHQLDRTQGAQRETHRPGNRRTRCGSQRPDDKAPMAFEAVRDVVLEAVEMPKIGWIKVRHRDGATGYIHVSQVWGI